MDRLELPHQHEQYTTSPRQKSVSSVAHPMSRVVAPIEPATQAFSRTIALNNVGAMHMERGDYVSSIKALTSSFLSFKKTYNEQKAHLLSLRTLIQESESHARHATKCGIGSSPPSSLEALIVNVGDLFSWRRRRCQTAATATGSSIKTSSARDIRNCSDAEHHPPFCCFHGMATDTVALTNHEFNDVCNNEASANDAAVVVKAVLDKAMSDVVMEQDDNDCCIDQDVTSVYTNPILLPPDFPVTQESCGFLSAAITLNLALANHLFGLELLERQRLQDTSSSRGLSSMIRQHLMSACRYYEYTIRLERARQHEEQGRIAAAAAVVAQSPFPPASSSSLLPPLFVSPLALLVVLNNMGQLHLVLSNRDRSQRWYRQLQSMLMFLLLHSSKNTTNSNDLAVFMENATLGLQNSVSRSMAAAA
jgi:hypothetical protein